ncbi:MAG: phage virion morphogenesis protein [Hydrogenophaga sp.]|nr:phage virion morphogenesis protein [Hydrogenophaga sp.]
MAQLIELTNRSGLDYLQAMLDRAKDFRPVLAEIGEDMAESTKRRFATTTAPDGTPWAPNSATTLARYSDLFARKKDGTLTKKVQAKIAGKKPLTGETRALATTINYQVLSDNEVGTGSPMVYAAMQQFGGKKSDFPNLWGNIPARPFLGASESDKINIADLVRSYMLGE